MKQPELPVLEEKEIKEENKIVEINPYLQKMLFYLDSFSLFKFVLISCLLAKLCINSVQMARS